MRLNKDKVYYGDYLKRQLKLINNFTSISGKHHRNLNKFIHRSLRGLKKNSKILDVGCGLGIWRSSILNRKYKITGIDPEEEIIRICKKLHKKSSYRVGNVYDLSSFGKFDAVVMREVIEHLYYPNKAINEIKKNLRPGGKLIITTPNYDSRLLFVIENTYNRFFGGACKPYKNDVHPNKLNERKLKGSLKDYLKVIKIEKIDLGISLGCVAINEKKR